MICHVSIFEHSKFVGLALLTFWPTWLPGHVIRMFPNKRVRQQEHQRLQTPWKSKKMGGVKRCLQVERKRVPTNEMKWEWADGNSNKQKERHEIVLSQRNNMLQQQQQHNEYIVCKAKFFVAHIEDKSSIYTIWFILNYQPVSICSSI